MYVYLSGCQPFSVVYSSCAESLLSSMSLFFSFLNDSISLSHLSLVRLSFFFFYTFLLISQYFHPSFSSSITVFASLFFPYHLNHLLLLSVYSHSLFCYILMFVFFIFSLSSACLINLFSSHLSFSSSISLSYSELSEDLSFTVIL